MNQFFGLNICYFYLKVRSLLGIPCPKTTLDNVCVVHRGLLSTLGDITEYIGGYHEFTRGVQYSGGYHEYRWGYHNERGEYHEYSGGVQYTGVSIQIQMFSQ